LLVQQAGERRIQSAEVALRARPDRARIDSRRAGIVEDDAPVGSDSDESVEEAMSPGPSSVRPSIGTDALLERMRPRNLTSYLVTTPDGRLVGLVRRDELE
jgi:Mg/Co/Ni transporter MgtE